MARPPVGVDIGTSGIRAAQVRCGPEGATVERFAAVALPDGAVRDGEITDIPTVAAALRELWRIGGFRSREVTLAVASQKVVVRPTELPWLPPAELRTSLPFQVADTIPMPVEQAVLDFHAVEELLGADGTRRVRGLLVAAAIDTVDTLVCAVQAAGLDPLSVDLTPFALLRALYVPGEQGDAEVIVDAGAGLTTVLVHSHGVPQFVRIVATGSRAVVQVVADRASLSMAEATRALGLGAGSAAEAEPGGLAPAVAAGLAVGIDGWVEDIRGSLDYYLAQHGAAAVGRILLAGGGACLPGLAARLAAATRVPVQQVAAVPGVRASKGVDAALLQRLGNAVAVPVGLAALQSAAATPEPVSSGTVAGPRDGGRRAATDAVAVAA